MFLDKAIGCALLLATSACGVASEGAMRLHPADGAADGDASTNPLHDRDGSAARRDADADRERDARAQADSGPSLACNGHVELCARRYNEVAYPSTHNAHAAKEYGYSAVNANQLSGLDVQLRDGVRAFLMDVYEYQGRHVLCHGPCQLSNTPHADWLSTLRSFLDQEPREVVTIIYQDGLAVDQIVEDFVGAGLASYVYTPGQGGDFPTLGEMIAENRRLVVTAENGRPPPAWFLHVWDLTWDTPYEFRNVGDFNCTLNRGARDNPLFLVNHWLSSGIGSVYLPSEDGARQANSYEVLSARLEACRHETGQLPNFIAVDFYEHGDLFRAVDALNGF